MPIGRNSFIQMTKLSNVKGRITYISSHAKQENLYAVYETIERKFWRELAKCNQEEFAKSGTEGKCIEARELIMLCQRVLQNISRIDCCSFLQIILNRIMEQSVLLLCTTIKERPIITFI